MIISNAKSIDKDYSHNTIQYLDTGSIKGIDSLNQGKGIPGEKVFDELIDFFYLKGSISHHYD